jgi:hypothetical protein
MDDQSTSGETQQRRYAQYSGYPLGRFRAPSFLVGSLGLGLLVFAVVDRSAEYEQWLPQSPLIRYGAGILAVLLLAHQAAATLYSRRRVIDYGLKRILRRPEEGIGKPETQSVNASYIRNLVSQGYEKYSQFDTDVTVDLLLEPQELVLRATEEIEPTTLTSTHSVTKDIFLKKKPSRAFMVPIAEIPKGVLLDGLSVQVNSKPATVLSYEDSLLFAALLVFICRLAETKTIEYPQHGTRDNADTQATEGIRNQIARDVYRVSLSATELEKLSREAEPRKCEHGSEQSSALHTSRAEALVEKLESAYVLFALVDQPVQSFQIHYSRLLSAHSAPVPRDRSTNRRNELRFRLGQFPCSLHWSTSLMYKCGSYHLRARLPEGLFVQEHRLYEQRSDGTLVRVYQDRFRRSVDEPVASWVPPEEPTDVSYMRARDHRALPYAHFYARNAKLFKRFPHMHVIDLAENPFVTLRLAATLLALLAAGIFVAGVSITGFGEAYDIKSTAIALVVTVPGILASWSRQVFGVDALRRACLTTQLSLRATTILSLVGLALAVIQDAGGLRWAITIRLFNDTGPELPIYDGFWVVLWLIASLVAIFVAGRYYKRRHQYLALRRRASISERNNSLATDPL